MLKSCDREICKLDLQFVILAKLFLGVHDILSCHIMFDAVRSTCGNKHGHTHCHMPNMLLNDLKSPESTVSCLKSFFEMYEHTLCIAFRDSVTKPLNFRANNTQNTPLPSHYKILSLLAFY